MAEQTIVFAQGIEMPPDILAQVQQMKPAGFTLHMLPPAASAAEIATAIREAEYLLGFPRFLPDEAYTEAKRLKLLQVLSAGYDYVNIAGARKARIPICANGGANSVAVAEHAIMLMLAVYRKLVAFHQNVAGGRWHQGIPRTVGIYELEGKTVGLVGLGNIGRQVARRVKAFDAQVIYYDALRRSPQEEAEGCPVCSTRHAAGDRRRRQSSRSPERQHPSYDCCPGPGPYETHGDFDQYLSWGGRRRTCADRSTTTRADTWRRPRYAGEGAGRSTQSPVDVAECHADPT